MKILYKNILLLTLVAAQSNLFAMNFARNGWQHTKNFFTTGEGFAKGMKGLGTYTYFGMASLAVAVEYKKLQKHYQDADNFNVSRPIAPEVQEFVQSVLKEHNFPKRVYTAPVQTDNFGVGMGTDGKYIYVPFTEHELNIAKKVHRDPHATSNDIDTLRGAHKNAADNLYAVLKNLPEELQRANGLGHGFVSDKSSLDIWKSQIIHEGSHYLHYDAFTPFFLHPTLPVVLHVSSKYISRKIIARALPLMTIPFIVQGICRIPLLYGKLKVLEYFGKSTEFSLRKYNEWRADQEIIKRVTDPEILEARSAHDEKLDQANKLMLKNILKLIEDGIALALQNEDMENYQRISAHKHKLTTLQKYPWLDEFEDVHPRYIVRARYFKKAAEKLRKQQEKN